MRSFYLLLALLFLSTFSMAALNASEKVFYNTSGYAVVWYFSGESVPSMVPVGYTNHPVYISDVSPAQRNDTFIVEFKPFNETTGVFSATLPFVTVGTFKLNNESSYTIPTSFFDNAGQYRITDAQWINPMNITSFLLFNSSIFPQGESISQSSGFQFTLIWTLLVIIIVLILVLFALLFSMMKKIGSRRRR